MRRWLVSFDDSIHEGENAKAAVLLAAESDTIPFGGSVYVIDLDWLLRAKASRPDVVARFQIGAEQLPLEAGDE